MLWRNAARARRTSHSRRQTRLQGAANAHRSRLRSQSSSSTVLQKELTCPRKGFWADGVPLRVAGELELKGHGQSRESTGKREGNPRGAAGAGSLGLRLGWEGSGQTRSTLVRGWHGPEASSNELVSLSY